MLTSRIRATLVVLAASAGLAGCTTMGPYGGVSVGAGYGSPYGYDYGYGYGSPYGYGYGYPGYGYGSYLGGLPYFGWHDGYYYPGSGYYVYDPYGGRHQWDEKQKRFWEAVIEKARQQHGAQATSQLKENFSGFSTQAATPTTTEQKRSLDNIRQRIRAQQVEQSRIQASASGTATADRESLRRISDVRRGAQSERSVRSESSSSGGLREAIEQRRARRGGNH